jgi:hypothetical protein
MQSETAFDERIEAVRASMRTYAGGDDSPPMQVLSALLELCRNLRARQDDLTELAAGVDLQQTIEAAVRRAAAAGLTRAAQEVQRASAWHRWAVGCLAVGITIGICVPVAWRAGQSAAEAADAQAATGIRAVMMRGGPGAAWLASVAVSNDLDGRAQWCADKAHLAEQAGGIVCQVPLWIQLPPAR